MAELAATNEANEALTLQIAQILRNGLGNTSSPTINSDIKLNILLNGDNYPLWSRLMKVEIGVRDNTDHITGINTPSSTDDSAYRKWEREDLRVISWIIQNVEPHLAPNYVEFPTAKSLWDSLATTYGSRRDSFQIYDLYNQARQQIQGTQTLQDYWNKLQSLWLAIDRRQPNPMKLEADIAEYNRITQEQRLFNFLAGLDGKFEMIRREILRREPLPSAESAYGEIRQEAARDAILHPTTSGNVITAGDSSSQGIGIGSGLATRNSDRSTQKHKSGGFNRKIDKSKLFCTHCNRAKHTNETCFLLHGFPDWWEDGHKPGKPNNTRIAAAAGSHEATNTSGGHGINGKGLVAAGSSGAQHGGSSDNQSGTKGGHSYTGDHWAWY
ncbi:Unknown protein [Striga hermonthica]|uniref:Retrotransposon Copia-like N-terminal domain-containing protein n=1 Tax=Striga hermonthica TaxID=68872 RepID=A0A9N7RKV1_STRHE|nr:Unknown protein [Striga hermonthica]